VPAFHRRYNNAQLAAAVNATGTPMFLLVCPTGLNDASDGPTECGVGQGMTYTASVWRDLPAGRDPYAIANGVWAEYCNLLSTWGSFQMNILDHNRNEGAPNTGQVVQRPGVFVDNDIMTVGCNDSYTPGISCNYNHQMGPQLSLVEERFHFAYYCIMGGDMTLGSDLRFASASTLELLLNTELIGVNQDSLALRAETVWRGAVDPAGGAPVNASAPMAGFIGAGNDLPGSGEMTVQACVTACVANAQCAGVTFEGNASVPPSGTVNCYLKGAKNFDADPAWTSIFTNRQPVFINAKRLWNGDRAVGIFSMGDADADATVTWDMLRLGDPEAWASADVRDMFAHASLGTALPSIKVTVSGHGVAALRISKTLTPSEE